MGGEGRNPESMNIEGVELFIFQNEVTGSKEVQSQIRLFYDISVTVNAFLIK